MIKICICDDMPDQLELMSGLIKEYTEERDLDVEIRLYSHPDELLRTCEMEAFQIYILDVVMPMLSGIEVGKGIRGFDREAQIIYATTEPGFALQSFVANPINYLLKPIEKAQFFDTLTLAISKVDMIQQSTFAIKTREGLRVLKMSSVVCCEYFNHTAKYTLANGETVTTRTIKGSFSEHIAPLLLYNYFLQSHSSFVLNMSQAEKFSKDGFIMRGGMLVPIATKQYPVVRDAYMDYLMSKESKI